jgi:hypothetical protein
VTWQEYESGLQDRLINLHGRVHGRAYRALPSRRVYIHVIASYPGSSRWRQFVKLFRSISYIPECLQADIPVLCKLLPTLITGSLSPCRFLAPKY